MKPRATLQKTSRHNRGGLFFRGAGRGSLWISGLEESGEMGAGFAPTPLRQD